MFEFKVGDWVYGCDWCYGRIAEIDGPVYYVEFEELNGGGCLGFELEELRPAKSPELYMISKLCYELYKVDWESNHGITADKKKDSIRKYYEFLVSEFSDWQAVTITYADYLAQFGYDGEMCACYREFLDTDYLEDDYICGLLNDNDLIAQYYKDVKWQED
jgi:hypothetical protein